MHVLLKTIFKTYIYRFVDCPHGFFFVCVQASEFQAQPLPSFPTPPLPPSSKCLTEPAPFNLSTENRGAVKAEKWGQKVWYEV